MKVSKQASLSFLLIFSCLFACSSDREEVANFSSARSLYVDYIASHTSGIISSKSNIKVKLAKKVENAKPVMQDISCWKPKIKSIMCRRAC